MFYKIKILLGLTTNEKDALIGILLEQSTNDVLNYCHLERLDPSLENIVVDLTIRRYNKLGTEGLESESYSGMSYSYETEMPDIIKTQLNSHRRVRVL